MKFISLCSFLLIACSHQHAVRTPAALGGAGYAWNQSQTWNNCGRYDDVVFTNAQTGFTINGCGEVYSTRDQGSRWEVIHRADNNIYLRTIDFLDDGRTGFIGTLTDNTFLKTTDGGVTWNNISSSLPGHKSICGVDHFGSVVFAVGNYQLTGAQFYRSNNAGNTWELIDLSRQASGLIDVKFLSPKSGFIAGTHTEKGAIILRTNNGGTTWNQVYPPANARPGLYPTEPSDIMWKLDFVNETIGYGAIYSSTSGSSKIVKTSDGGRNWETIVIDAENNRELEGIGFIDANIGWAGGYGNGVYETTDGGRTWAYHEGLGGNFNRAFFIRPHVAFASGNGVFRISRGGGRQLSSTAKPSVVPHTSSVTSEKVCVQLDRNTHVTVRLLDRQGKFIDEGPLAHSPMNKGEHCFAPKKRLSDGQYRMQFRTHERIFSQPFQVVKSGALWVRQ